MQRTVASFVYALIATGCGAASITSASPQRPSSLIPDSPIFVLPSDWEPGSTSEAHDPVAPKGQIYVRCIPPPAPGGRWENVTFLIVRSRSGRKDVTMTSTHAVRV